MEPRIREDIRSLVEQSESDSESSDKFFDLLTRYLETKRELEGSASHRAKLAEFIGQLSSERKNQTQPSELPVDEIADILARRFGLLTIGYDFKPGDLVRWKQGLRNKLNPPYNQPAIVIDALKSPLYDAVSEGGSPYFREPLDLVLGVLVSSEFVIYYFDKRRFEPFPKGLTT